MLGLLVSKGGGEWEKGKMTRVGKEIRSDT